MGAKKNTKVALITGITGQDGAYLAGLLLKKGYEVHGLIRRSSTFNTQRIDGYKKYKDDRLFLHYGDLSDSSSLNSVMMCVEPDEIYNLGAQSHVRISFDIPEYTSQVTGLGTLYMLEAMRRHAPKARFYQASSSEMFGDVLETPQKETTRFNAQSPYGIAKVFAHETACRYRDAYGLFICCGILFNHESPNRGENFVTRKVVRGAVNAKLYKSKDNILYLGNLDAERDWGYAPEYVEAMWRMLQQDKPDDYVIATGEAHTVKELAEVAFRHAGFDLVWSGRGLKEKGLDRKTGKILVAIDPVYFRPNEVNQLLGDASKAKKQLKWKPKTSFQDLVKVMMEAELKTI